MSTNIFDLFGGANLVEQRNSTNAQTFNIYNTYTDASNYERGFMRWNSNVFEIGTEAAGTGTLRTLQLGSLATAGIELPLGSGTLAKTTIGARDGIFLQTRSVNRVFLSENGVTNASFYPTNDGTVDLGLPDSSGGGWSLLGLRERSADPADPAEGQSAVWQSDGTGAGDDGDIMVKITAGGVTKTGTLIDFSAIP